MYKRISQQFIDILQKPLNQFLMLDSNSKKRFQALQGKVVKIELLPLHVIFYLNFTSDGIHCDVQREAQHLLPADTTIRGTPIRLLYMSLVKNNRQKFFADDITMEGNLELGQQVVDLFDKLDIDWEEKISQIFGDMPTHFLSKFVKKTFSFGKNIADSMHSNINEYIHEEIYLFPPLEAIQDFFHDVDVIRMDVDRLEARIKHLQTLGDKH